MVFHIRYALLLLVIVCCISYNHVFVDSFHMNMIAHRNLYKKVTRVTTTISLNSHHNYNNNRGNLCICMSSSTEDSSPIIHSSTKWLSMPIAVKASTALLGLSLLSFFHPLSPSVVADGGLQPGKYLKMKRRWLIIDLNIIAILADLFTSHTSSYRLTFSSSLANFMMT